MNLKNYDPVTSLTRLLFKLIRHVLGLELELYLKVVKLE